MNFVIIAYSFPPGNGPECFCSGRFASALVNAGHTVHVVTVERKEWGISRAVYDTLVDKRVKVSTFNDHGERSLFGPRLRYLTHEDQAVNNADAIATLKSVLSQYENPILVSRTHPISSVIIAWHCRKLADKWVAHLSDPIPWYGEASLSARIKNRLASFWIRRALRSADAISLTCERVRRFYSSYYGDFFKKKPCVVTSHIGNPPLVPAVSSSLHSFLGDKSVITIVHSGLLYLGRGAAEIIGAVDCLNAKGVNCRFLQVGPVDASALKLVRESQYVVWVDSGDPARASEAQLFSDVIFVPDLITHLEYSPFLASKFVYQIFGDKPIVVFSKPDSTMNELANNYPRSGLFFADCSEPEGLEKALRDAINSVGTRFERAELRGMFSREHVASVFVEFVKHLKQCVE